jgi:hypothetical protein
MKLINLEHLKRNCYLNNPNNHGACLSVRKNWLMEINGYDQSDAFRSGFHANDKDIYTRLKNLGVCVKWHPTLKLFHPWHEMTLTPSDLLMKQHSIISRRASSKEHLPFCGIDPSFNTSHGAGDLCDDDVAAISLNQRSPISGGKPWTEYWVETVMERLNNTFGHSRDIIIFGTRGYCDLVIKYMDKSKVNVTRFFDNDSSLWGTHKEGIEIQEPVFIPETFILVASSWRDQIEAQLLDLGYRIDDIIAFS